MRDGSLEERLANTELRQSTRSQSSLEGSADPGNDSASVTVENRFWATSVLVPQIGILLEITSAVGESPVGGSPLLVSLIGALVAAECLLRRFGPVIVSALWNGFLAAIVTTVGAFLVLGVSTGFSLPDPVTSTGFLVVSAAVTARQTNRANSR